MGAAEEGEDTEEEGEADDMTNEDEDEQRHSGVVTRLTCSDASDSSDDPVTRWSVDRDR